MKSITRNFASNVQHKAN